MKLFVAILAVACGLAAAKNAKCSTTNGQIKKCPPGQRCVIINLGNPNGPMRIPNSGQCFPGKLDYHAAQVYYERQDADKNGHINFGGAYAALAKLEPKATEAQLTKLTNDPRTGLLRRGNVSYPTFLQMYRTLYTETHKTGNTNPCAKNPCSKGQTCRRCKNTLGFCCSVISTASPTGSKLTHSERSQVNNLFTALNTDHASKTLSKAEFAALLNAVTADLDRTHNIKLYNSVAKTILAADKNKDGVVDYVEFVRACVALKKADQKDFHEFLKAAEKMKPLKIGSTCIPSKESANGKACPVHSTCQQTRIPVDHQRTVRRYTCKKDVPLSKYERAQVGNIFHAVDINHNNKLSQGEMYNLLNIIRRGLDHNAHTYHEEYEAITRNIYYEADANNDKSVSRQEFDNALTDLKNADPTDFHVFLKAARVLYPLHIGNVCLPFRPVGTSKPCPHDSTCQIHQTPTTKMPKNVHHTNIPAYRRTTPKPSVWKCVKNKGLTNDEKHQVSNIFTALDKDQDNRLLHGNLELYQLLRTVRTTFPYSSHEYQAISHSVYYNSDVNKDGYVSRQEFFNGVTTLKNANPAGFPGFLKACEKLKPLSVGDVCLASMYSYAYQACPKHSTCQQQRTKKLTCVRDVPLTKREKSQARNIFRALDVNHDKKISGKEISDLLYAVQDWTRLHHNSVLYAAMMRSVYITYSDTNKDHYVELNEFLTACIKLKNADRKDFSHFLQISRQLKPLEIGQECSPFRSNYNDGACPAHSTCQVKLKNNPSHTFSGLKNTYTCVKDVALNKNEKHRAFNLFTALDDKHQHKLDNGDLAHLLQGVRAAVDNKKYAALIEAITRSTHFDNDDLNKDQYIEWSEFLKIVTSIKNRDPKDFSVFLKAAAKIKPLKTGSVCRPTGASDACPKHETCQLSQKASGQKNSRTGTGPSYIAPKYICTRDRSLSSAERQSVIKLFHAMDKSGNNKLRWNEYTGLLHQVYEEATKTHDYSLQTSILESVYYTVSDTNKDHNIELNEFIAGCAKLKNRDPKDFGTFLKIASRIKQLKEGYRCQNSIYAPAQCPADTVCRSVNGKYTCIRTRMRRTTKDPWSFPDLDGGVVHVQGRRE